MAHLTQTRIFLKDNYYNFHVAISPFIVQNRKKKILKPIHSYENVPFRVQNGPLALDKMFLVKTNDITFIHLLAPFIVQNL